MGPSVYYAHCIAIYNTPQEARDCATLRALDFRVLNPNTPDIQEQCAECKARGGNVMEEVFRPLAQTVDVLAFRALPDGRIPSGVAKEIAWAQEVGVRIIELPSNIVGRVISLEETRAYLEEVGQR